MGQLLALGRHQAPCILLAQVVGRWGKLCQPGALRPADHAALGHRHSVPNTGSPSMPARPAPTDRHARPAFHPALLLRVDAEPARVLVMLWLWNHFTARGRLLIAGDVACSTSSVRRGAEPARAISAGLGLDLLRRPDGADVAWGRGRCILAILSGTGTSGGADRSRGGRGAGRTAGGVRADAGGLTRSQVTRRRSRPYQRLPGRPRTGAPISIGRGSELACQLKRQIWTNHTPQWRPGHRQLPNVAKPRSSRPPVHAELRPRPIDPIHRIEPPPMHRTGGRLPAALQLT